MPHSHDPLYEISIDVLNLSDDAKQAMFSIGLTHIGDLADSYYRFSPLSGAMVDMRDQHRLNIFFGEVKDKMIAAGYGEFVYDVE